MKHSVGWHIAMMPKIGFKLQLTATLGFPIHSMNGVSDDVAVFSAPEDSGDNCDEKAMVLRLVFRCERLMHAIRRNDEKHKGCRAPA